MILLANSESKRPGDESTGCVGSGRQTVPLARVAALVWSTSPWNGLATVPYMTFLGFANSIILPVLRGGP
jgi:hypothetical protein